MVPTPLTFDAHCVAVAGSVDTSFFIFLKFSTVLLDYFHVLVIKLKRLNVACRSQEM